MEISMMLFFLVTDRRTNEQADSRSWISFIRALKYGDSGLADSPSLHSIFKRLKKTNTEFLSLYRLLRTLAIILSGRQHILLNDKRDE